MPNQLISLKNHFFLTAFFMFILIQEIQAVPTLYPQHAFVAVNNQTTSNLVRDSIKPYKFYVLPPSEAKMNVTGLHSATANVGFCKELGDIQKYNRETLFLMNKMKKRQVELEENLRTLAEKIRHLQIQLSNYQNQPTEYERRQQEISLLEQDYNRQFARSQDLQNQLAQMYSSYIALYDAHSRREGGRVQFEFVSRWSENLLRLTFDNPRFEFEKIPTYNAVVRADSAVLPQLGVLGSVISYNIGGLRTTGGLLNFGSYPESLSGQAVLNLLGVCPYLFPDVFDLDPHDPRVDVQKMKYALTISYDIPTEFKFNLTVNYNLYQMYERIQTAGRSGGLFNSHNWSHDEEKKFFEDSFEIKWEWNTDKPWLSESQISAIESDLRARMLSRLANLLQLSSGPVLRNSFETNPDTGAIVLSKSLSQACPHVSICRGASIALSLLNSVFSSSKVSQETLRTLDVSMSEKISQNKILLQPMMTSYR